MMEMEGAKEMTLARGVDDAEMEDRRKRVIREGDPMALLAWKVGWLFSFFIQAFVVSLTLASPHPLFLTRSISLP
jgi:hypothetical protein